MRHFLLTVFCLAILPLAGYCQVSAPVVSPQWFDDMGRSTGSATSTDMKIDAADNVYVIGNFSGQVDFDPSTAVYLLSTPPGTTSGFIGKYKSDGTLIWIFPLNGTGTVTPSGLDLGSDGSINISGKYTGAMDADPGVGLQNLGSAGGNDAFIIHLNSSGGFLWGKSIGGTGEDAANKLASDATGNLYVAMQFQSTVSGGGATYTAQGTTDGLLLKYDATGNIVFAIDLGYNHFAETTTASGVVVDKNNLVDVIGYMDGPVNLNPLGTAYVVGGTSAMYVAQYTADGTAVWGTSIAQGIRFNNNINIALDASNQIYVSGFFTYPLIFGGGATNDFLRLSGIQDVFIAKYLANGTLIWHKDVGGANSAVAPTGMVVTNNTIYLGGYFTGAPYFDPATVVSPLNYHGQQDLFLAKYMASTGAYVNAINAGNANCNSTKATGVGVLGGGDMMLTGAFCSTTNFAAADCTEFNEKAQAAAGSQDMFLVRYSLVTPIANNTIGNPQNCPGAAAGPLVLTGSTPTGGTGSYTYEWQSSTDGITFSDIGAYDKDYPVKASNSLVYYIRKVFSGCAAPSISSVLQVGPSVNGPVQNNIIDESGVIEGCGGAGATNLKASLPTGGGGNYNYLWQTSPDKINWTDAEVGPNTTPNGQNLGAISFLFTFYVRRIVTTTGCNTPSISPVVTFPAVPDIANYTTHTTNGTVFCGSGDPGTLTLDKPVTGGIGNYTYQWKSTTTNDYQDIPGATSPSYSPGVITASTHFTIEVRSGPCYTGDPGKVSNPIDITIHPQITITNNTIAQATPDGTLCLSNADPSVITGLVVGGGTGTGYFAYQWQLSTDKVNYTDIKGANDKDYDPSKIAQTTYYRRVVTYTDNSSCATPNLSNVLTFTVGSAPISNNTIAQTDPDLPLICSVPADPKPITGSDATGTGFTYQWQSSTDGVNFTDITNVTTRDYDPPQINQTTSYRRAAIIPDPCLLPNYSNIITINISASATANTITAPAVTSFCDNGDGGIITGTEVSGTGVTYRWQSSPDNVTYTDISDANEGNYPSYDPPPGTTTVYYRRQVTTSVCNVPSVTQPVGIMVYVTPVVTTSADSVTICAGNNTTLTASGGANFKWTPAKGLSATDVASPTASPDSTTIYTVEVANGTCSVNATVKVIVVPRPTVDAGPDQKMFKGETAQLNGKVSGNNVQFSWSPATYLDDPNILNPKATPPESITYTLTATADNGCAIITDDVRLNVYEKVQIPTAFTPNNDGKNDTWEILGLNTYPNSILTIFSRDGAQLYRTVGYTKAWDGTFNGKSLPFGTYYYVLDLKAGFKLMSGWVALIK